MNNIDRSTIIISSMTKAEKRSFRLYTNVQSGEKSYMNLFDIIGMYPTEKSEKIQEKFHKKTNQKNIEIAAAYLYRQLLDFIAQNNTNKNIQPRIFNTIQKSKILFQRRMYEEALEELEEAKKVAQQYEDDIMQILIARTEMNYMSQLGFPLMDEKELVNKQMQFLQLTKYTRTINQYLFLRDILDHRLLHKGLHKKDEKEDILNDLVLSEFYLVARNSQSSFHAEKLHLLFRSTYYLEIGNYSSAARNYKQLIELFAKHRHLMQDPPIYYLGAIDGILDSLLTMGIYNEMHPFIDELDLLCSENYSSDFLLKATWKSYFYQLHHIIHTSSFSKLHALQKSKGSLLLKKIELLPLDVQLQYYLSNTLVLFAHGKYKEAHAMIRNIFEEGKIYQRLLQFRMARIVNLLINVELGYFDFDFIENEIISMKRKSSNLRLSETEKVIFKFIQSYPLPKDNAILKKLYSYFSKKFEDLAGNKFERKMLKHFNFATYIQNKLNTTESSSTLHKK